MFYAIFYDVGPELHRNGPDVATFRTGDGKEVGGAVGENRLHVIIQPVPGEFHHRFFACPETGESNVRIGGGEDELLFGVVHGIADKRLFYRTNALYVDTYGLCAEHTGNGLAAMTKVKVGSPLPPSPDWGRSCCAFGSSPQWGG